MNDSQDQLSAVLDRFIGPGRDDNPHVDENLPRVALPSPMVLTRDQEDALVEWCIDYDERLQRDLGREMAQEENWVSSAGDPIVVTDEGCRTFLGKRRLWEMIYNLKLDWRAKIYGGVFAETNYTVPITRRYVQQMISRATNYFFGTSPWFQATPEGANDAVLAEEVNRFLKYKARRKRLRRVLGGAIKNAFIRGEQVLKATFRHEEDIYETDAMVAVDPVSGQPMVASDGDYIYFDDNHQEMETPNPDGSVAVAEVLSRDMKTPWPGDEAFEMRRVKRAITKFSGAELSQVYFMDFMVPRDAPSIEEAEFCAHHYDIAAFDLAQQILQADNPENRSVVLEFLRELGTGSGREEGALISEPRPDLGESFGDEGGDVDEHSLSVSPKSRIIECYFHRDVNGSGTVSGFIMIDLGTRRPIHYNYVANVTPDGKRPFPVVRINPVDNRWHGGSMAELFETLQKFGDLMVNRFTHATSKEGNVVFWSPNLTIEGEANPHLEMGANDTWTPKDPDDVEKILKVVSLVDPGQIEHIFTMMQWNSQWAANLSGVSGSNDGQAAGLQTSKLATGIREMHKSGQELFAPLIDDLEEGQTEALEKWAQLELHHLNQAEVYEYMEGSTVMSATMDPQAARDLFINIRLELTRYHNEALDVQMSEADLLVEKFFSKHPIIQQKTLAFYRHRLQLREVPNVDELLIPFTPEEWMAVNGGMLGGPPAPPGGGMGVSSPDPSIPSPI